MMNIYRLLQKAGILFDPDRDGIACPWTAGQAGQGRQDKRRDPDNLVYDKHGGRARTFEEDRENRVFVWNDYSPETEKRTAEFTDYDAEALENWKADPDRPNLSEKTYRQLKPIYADGLSAAKASKDARNLNGPRLSSRTLDKYWAAMAVATAKQLEGSERPYPGRGKGGRRKEPEKTPTPVKSN